MEKAIDDATVDRLGYMDRLAELKEPLQLACRRLQFLEHVKAKLKEGGLGALAGLDPEPVVLEGAGGFAGAALGKISAALRRPRLKKRQRHVPLPPAFGAGPRRTARRARH